MRSQDGFSIIVPVYNEQDSIKELSERIASTCTDFPSYEVIFVDDGSTDDTALAITAVAMKVPNVHFLSIDRRSGKSRALAFAVPKARFDTVVVMDGDLQDDPVDVGAFLRSITRGYDVVCGWRVRRQDVRSKRFASYVFNVVMSLIARRRFHDSNCGFKAFRKKAFLVVDASFSNHRFFMVEAARLGLRTCEIRVTNHKRKYGASKYGAAKYGRFCGDLVSYLASPRNRQGL